MRNAQRGIDMGLTQPVVDEHGNTMDIWYILLSITSLLAAVFLQPINYSDLAIIFVLFAIYHKK